MRNPATAAVLAIGILAAAGPACLGDDAAGDALPPDTLKFFEAQVRPLLAARCLDCHGEDDQSGGLRLDGTASVLTGGESGPAVDADDPAASLLLEAIRYESYEMPPDGRMSDAEIRTLERWVELGAPWPGGGADHAPRSPESKISDEDREHWSFQPVADPDPPALAGDDFSRGDLDRFILRAQRAAGLEHAAPADRRTLVRRVYETTIGLPPTPDEAEAFLADDSPDAYARLVDRLLADPRHGEHAATAWLDLVRYAESDGYKADYDRPHAWRYRDWVIDALNRDLPFDRFLRDQLAGDELRPGDPDALAATGFLRLGIYEYNQRDVLRNRDRLLEDVTDTVGDAVLGLGMGCAKCHDHKFDPILQRDYYRLRAFFANLSFRDPVEVEVPDDTNSSADGAAWRAATADIRARLADVERSYRAGKERSALSSFTDEFQAIYATPEADRTPDEQQIAELIERQVIEKQERNYEADMAKKEVWVALRAELAGFDHLKPRMITLNAARDIGPTAPATFIPGKERLGEIVPGFLTLLSPEPARVAPLPEVPHSSGRRATLARWLTRDDHPLVPRVIVNRVWRQHFGTGLVATPSDFGHLGEPPSHPELLDWLTSRFVEHGWSLRWLRREILTSATFRQAGVVPSDRDAAVAALDPAGRLLSTFPVRRLTAEQVRDALLAVSGELDSARVGGPGEGETTKRRAVYLKVHRNDPDPLLAAFDRPDRITGTGERLTTTTPAQSLLMLNGAWVRARAAALAKRVGSEADPVSAAFRRVLLRDPSPGEHAAAEAFAEKRGLPELCHALLNTNEFLYVD